MKFLAVLLLLMSSAFAKDIVLSSENTVSLFGPVDRASIGGVMHELTRLSQVGKKEDPIYLVLYTPGGSVSAGLELIEYMNTQQRKTLLYHEWGHCALKREHTEDMRVPYSFCPSSIMHPYMDPVGRCYSELEEEYLEELFTNPNNYPKISRRD